VRQLPVNVGRFGVRADKRADFSGGGRLLKPVARHDLG
jgi:hypothetical protein